LNLAASTEPLLGSIVSKLDDLGFLSKFIANERTLLWSKLCFLGPFALVTSASGLNVGEILADSTWKQKLDFAVAEACAVANASGAQVDPVRILEGFDAAPAGMRSSMQKDIAAGRQLELDAIGGPIIIGGQSYGIHVPGTAALIAAIRSKLD
jgi:2-dehydropantoate 2-reductase